MTIWIDAQLSPALGQWMTATFGIEAYSVAFLGLRDAEDETTIAPLAQLMQSC